MRRWFFSILLSSIVFTIFSTKVEAAPEGFYEFPDRTNLNCTLTGTATASFFINEVDREDLKLEGVGVYAVESPFISPIPNKRNDNYGEPTSVAADGTYTLRNLDCNNPVFVQFIGQVARGGAWEHSVLKAILIEWDKIRELQERPEGPITVKYNLKLGEEVNTSTINYSVRVDPDPKDATGNLPEETVEKFPVLWPVGIPDLVDSVSIAAGCLENILNCAGALIDTGGAFYEYIAGGAPQRLYTTDVISDRRWRRNPVVGAWGMAPDVPEDELPSCEVIKNLNDKSFSNILFLGKGGYAVKGAMPGQLKRTKIEAKLEEIGDIDVCNMAGTTYRFNQFTIPGNDPEPGKLESSYFPYYMLAAVREPHTEADTIPTVCNGPDCTPQEAPEAQKAVFGGGRTKTPKEGRNASDTFVMFQRPGLREKREEEEGQPEIKDSGISEIVTPGREWECPEGQNCAEQGVEFELKVYIEKTFWDSLCSTSSSGACEEYNDAEARAKVDIKMRIPEVEYTGYDSCVLGSMFAPPGKELNSVGSLGIVRGNLKDTKDNLYFKSNLGGCSENAAAMLMDSFKMPWSTEY